MNNYKNFLRAGAMATTVLAGASTAIAEPGSDTAAVGPSINVAYVAVDFGARQGDLLRTERFNTWDNDDPVPELYAESVEFLNEQGLHAQMYRVGLKEIEDLCDVVVNECDFSSIADWLDNVSDVTDSLVVHLTPDSIIREKRPPSEAKDLLKLTIKELKQRFPKIDYIENTNEPDWIFHGRQILVERTEPILQPDEVYDYYVPFYEAVNEVNDELRLRSHSERIKVGGPTLTGMNETWTTAFLDGYAADTNPHKRLDFISYHGYGEFSDDFRSFHMYKSDPSQVSTQRERLEGWLKERHITKHIPTFVTETGIYPGGSGDAQDPGADYIRQAAGMASMHYWWANQPRTIPFNWVVRHGSNPRKDQLVTHSEEGALADTFTPYGNMLLMQSMMKDIKVEATSDSLSEGQGVYAVASKDKSGATIMVWNYQGVNEGRFLTTIDMSRLPANLKHGPVRQTTYRIDQNTSNYWTDPERANLQQVDEQIVNLGKNCCSIVDLEPNALVLILLEPAAE